MREKSYVIILDPITLAEIKLGELRSPQQMPERYMAEPVAAAETQILKP